MPGSGYTNIGPIDGEFTETIISSTAAGTTAMVAGVSGQGVRLYKGLFASAGANTLTIGNGTIILTGGMAMATGTTFVLPFDGTPWFESTGGNALNIIQTGTGTITGRIYYKQG